MNNLKKYYNEKVVPELMKQLGYKNPMAVPRVKAVVINVGIGKGLKEKEYLEMVKTTLTRITGQKPVETKSRHSISNFKIKEGQVIGTKVTLRGTRMWDFLEKVVKITLPRVRDFHGLTNKAFDNKGNYSMGFNEYLAFPEIKMDEVEKTHGLQVNICTTSKNRAEGRALLAAIGFPFQAE
ncbi:MAG: 50S ribosomal protein L5 [Parcubacteria group bacterium]